LPTNPHGTGFEHAGARAAQLSHPRPFVKWAGGKRRLLEQYSTFFPPMTRYRRYFEPFLGGGAVFFHLQPKNAVLGDLNAELINCYKMVKEQPEELIALLKKYRSTEKHFYQTREINPSKLPPLERASRFIYLNKTCYNGLYRVNSNGMFNVPFGRYQHPSICDAAAIRAASLALKSAQLKISSFEKTAATARRGDFIYFDPPYVPLSRTASFTNYTSDDFDEAAQIKLARLVRELDSLGCLVMVSNSDTEFVRELYSGFVIETARCNRAINSFAAGRGSITELVIRNY